MGKMKDSGIAWIGEIPEDWIIGRVKNAFVRKQEKAKQENPTILSLARSGVKVRDISRGEGQIAESYYNYNPVENEDLLINPMDLQSGANCSISEVEGVISPAYINLKAKENINPIYYDYYFKTQYWSMAFFAHGKGVSYDNRWTLNAETLFNYYIPIPSKKEQDRIAKYLKEKVSKIDKAIEVTKATIEEYKTYKQAVITDIITKGLSGEALKDTNNIYIPHIPESWELKKIKYIFYIKKVLAGKEGFDILSITQKGIKKKDISGNVGQIASDYSNYQIVNVGDFAMNHMDLLTGWVDVSKFDGVTSPDYRVFNFISEEGYSRGYYLYLMQMCYMNHIFYGLGQGVSNLGRWRLQADKFLNFTIPVPPYEEQEEIAKYLDVKCGEIDKIVAEKEELVLELENYKKSLIYEYVTGKKEVPAE